MGLEMARFDHLVSRLDVGLELATRGRQVESVCAACGVLQPGMARIQRTGEWTCGVAVIVHCREPLCGAVSWHVDAIEHAAAVAIPTAGNS